MKPGNNLERSRRSTWWNIGNRGVLKKWNVGKV